MSEAMNVSGISAVSSAISQRQDKGLENDVRGEAQKTQRSEVVGRPELNAEKTVERARSAEESAAANEEMVAKVEEAIDRLNNLMKDSQRNLEFTVDKRNEEVVIKVIDTTTDEVVRQIPNEESLRFAESLEGVLGVIFNDRA